MAFSLMNGLSEMGSGIAKYAGAAGLELQKNAAASDLLQQKGALELQQTQLANSLAAARESTGRAEQAGYASTAADKLQAFELAKQRDQQNFTANSDTAEMKLLRALYPELLPPRGGGGAPAASTAPSAGPAAAQNDVVDNGTFDGSAPSPELTSSGQSASTGAAPSRGIPDTTDNPMLASLLKIPQTGSEASIRMAIARDVNKDPSFAQASPGDRGAEVENRLAIAKGSLAKPETRDALARAIADYQLSPLDQRARQMQGGPETMKKVMDLNPDYQEGMYPEISKMMVAFNSGKEGSIVRSANVGVQHLDVMSDAANALKNRDVTAFNSLMNTVQQQFGVSAPNTFDGLKQIVATEIEKAVAGGIGSEADRDRLIKSLASKNSPEQLQDMLNGFRSLMAGQVMGLKKQYEAGTPDNPRFRDNGPFAFDRKLMPATVKALKLGHSGDSDAGSSDATDNSSSLDSSATTPSSRPPLSSFLRQ